MPHGRSQHPNAALTPKDRRKMVGCLVGQGWTVEMTAEWLQIDAKTVRKWRDRFLAEGEAGLLDRSSRPHRSPKRTPARLGKRVLHLRRSYAAPDRLGHAVETLLDQGRRRILDEDRA